MAGVQVEAGPDGVLRLTIDRPPANALTDAEYHILTGAFARARMGAGVACVLLTAVGRLFCAGGDIAAQRTPDLEPHPDDQAAPLGALLGLLDCTVPVIAAVNGTAAGVGALMALGADVIVASESAQFVLPEIDTGAIGGYCTLSRSVPPALARAMAMTGRRVPARRLAELGVIAQLSPPARLADEALALAHSIAGRCRAVDLTDWRARCESL